MTLGRFMVGLAGPELSGAERELLRRPGAGGVLLFTRNYADVPQLRALCREIHELRSPPLLIAVDQEGGPVQRFREPFTDLPPLGALGRCYDQDADRALGLARTTGWLMAAELRSVGVDLSFAPVTDLDHGLSTVIGERAFHREPDAVTRLARAYIRGMGEAGMAATLKHFPGHGAVAADSHRELPVDERRWSRIEHTDLLPFARLAREEAGAMMVAHVVYSRCDPAPAGFSQYWIRDVLRRRLRFQGVVFSDDLGMAAAAHAGDFASRARAALQAGCDMVLVGNELDALPALLERVPASDPVSALRLARLHGRDAPDWDALHRSRRWREAERGVRGYDHGRSLELPV